MTGAIQSTDQTIVLYQVPVEQAGQVSQQSNENSWMIVEAAASTAYAVKSYLGSTFSALLTGNTEYEKEVSSAKSQLDISRNEFHKTKQARDKALEEYEKYFQEITDKSKEVVQQAEIVDKIAGQLPLMIQSHVDALKELLEDYNIKNCQVVDQTKENIEERASRRTELAKLLANSVARQTNALYSGHTVDNNEFIVLSPISNTDKNSSPTYSLDPQKLMPQSQEEIKKLNELKEQYEGLSRRIENLHKNVQEKTQVYNSLLSIYQSRFAIFNNIMEPYKVSEEIARRVSEQYKDALEEIKRDLENWKTQESLPPLELPFKVKQI